MRMYWSDSHGFECVSHRFIGELSHGQGSFNKVLSVSKGMTLATVHFSVRLLHSLLTDHHRGGGVGV